MGTSTPNLNLYKADDEEFVDVDQTLNDNLDILDTAYQVLEDAAVNNNVRARIRATAAKSAPNNTYTAIDFATEDFDSHNGHSTSANTNRYTFPMDGVYRLTGCATFMHNATGARGTRWVLNGTPIPASCAMFPAPPAGIYANVPCRSIIIEATAGQWVGIEAFQNSGGALNIDVVGPTDENASSMEIQRIGDLVP